jgi:hypothetical protein
MRQEFARGRDINALPPERGGDNRVDVLVQMKPDALSHELKPQVFLSVEKDCFAERLPQRRDLPRCFDQFRLGGHSIDILST